MKLRKYGARRRDGMRFSQYRKTPTGTVLEIWLRPEVWDRMNTARLDRNRLWKRAQRAAKRSGVACTAAESRPEATFSEAVR